MTEILLVAIVLLCVFILGLQLFRKNKQGDDELIKLRTEVNSSAETLLKLEAAVQKTSFMQEQLVKTVKQDSMQAREEDAKQSQRGREEDAKQFQRNREEMAKSLHDFEGRLEKVRETIERRLKDIQLENGKKLDEMRQTVDEKLQETLNKRISESFKLVSENLEKVQKGLGEMSELATGVGDLKKVFQNVKTRGVVGEAQLAAILEQFLSPEQYYNNVKIKENTTENVEFAVRLPGQNAINEEVLLPIDSKFPMEDYIRLLDMYEKVEDYSREEIQKSENQFASIVKRSAKLIADKYIAPPKTTNFALMFVPTEGLYSQILRQTGLFETLQRDYNITVVGPSNLVAFLNSLQMGFRTLAVQQRSNEVWQILAAVKSEFGKFETVLTKAQSQLSQASSNIDSLVGTRTRSIQRKLRDVEEFQEGGEATPDLLGLNTTEE